MANLLKDTTIKYVNKDFEGYKRDLMNYAQAHFSGSYQDYNESSPGMMIIELQAYVADVLSYYMDQQFLEIKAETARQIENIEAFAKMRGYKPKGLRSARVPVKWIAEVPTKANGQPDLTYAPLIYAGSQAIGPNGIVFETLEDLDLGILSASDGSNVLQYVPAKTELDVNNQEIVTSYAIRREVEMTAGETISLTASISDFTPFLKFSIGAANVQEVIDVFDDAGNQWYEVDYLAQNVVFDQVVNTGSDSSIVPYVLRYRAAPRRFTVERSVTEDVTYLQFGNGEGTKNDDDLIPSISNLSLPITGRKQFTNFALDPQNFLRTRGLGLCPQAGSQLFIRVRVGGGPETNVDAFTINKLGAINTFFQPSISTSNAIISSIEVVNTVPSEGGGGAETVAEIKTNAASFFASQMRIVTKEDFLTHVMTMPARFGRPVKAYVVNDELNPYAVNLHVLSQDPSGKLMEPSNILKQNIKTYLGKMRMMTEGINILSATILNIGIKFGVVISSRYNRAEVLTKCLLRIKNYFDVQYAQIGQPIVISDISAQLQNIDGVISVYRFDVTSMVGAPYSSFSIDVAGNSMNGMVYCPANSIFEIKFPDSDIIGESK